MITRIPRLKNFGIFHDFSWSDKELPEFKKFNLIYGWNRSGKTTISRVFASCEKKCVYDEIKFKQYPESGEFEAKTSDNVSIKNTNVASNTLPIKVFNQDFVEDNVSFEPSTSSSPIIYVSEKAIESKEKLKKLKNNVLPFNKAFEAAKGTRDERERTKSTFLTSLGREISNTLSKRNYNKRSVEDKINSFGIDNFTGTVLSPKDIDKYDTIRKSGEGEKQNTFQEFEFSFSFNGEIVDNFKKLFESIQKLLGKKVVSEVLERLKDDQALNAWVEQGFDLHKTKEEKEKCLFCQKPLDSDFLSLLSKHFSKDYEDLQKEITQLSAKALELKKEKFDLKNDKFHPDLVADYTKQVSALNDIITKSNLWIDSATSKLNDKHVNPLIIVTAPPSPEEFLSKCNGIVDELNKLVLAHNKKVENHATEVKNAIDKLELHLIAKALAQQKYKKLNSDIEEATAKEKTATEAVKENDAEISRLGKATSDIGIAIDKINRHLKEFFGREEIKLELDGDNKGYIIKRDEQIAKSLSESEKTAIAFSYFIVKVKSSKVDESIIFIDDPVSSFDSSFIYQAFSLIKNHFNEVEQLFISTHNFQFFNLVKDWFVRKNRNTEDANKDRALEGKDEKPNPCEFYMIKSILGSGQREARIVVLDNSLKNNKSEYNFLFRLLKDFNESQMEPTFEEIYNISNIGRRFFDIFADFKIPTNKLGQEEKMDRIVEVINNLKSDEDKISKTACDKVLWLINSFSHNSDPMSTIEHADKSESVDAIRILLNIVKESDPNHYKILEKEL